MSFVDYLNENEKVLYHWEIGPKGEIASKIGKKVKTNILGITGKKVFHFKKLKGYDRVYRDVPLKKISYLENAWHARNMLFLILGAILLIVGIGLSFNIYTLVYLIGPILLIAGIVLIIKGLKQYGYLMINGEDWKFNFNRKEDIKKIEQFIQEVYFIVSD
ncbi:MAG: hypothetical protein ACW99E_22455 [Promethearchaeota archaeon]|jgi:hypothetical protein